MEGNGGGPYQISRVKILMIHLCFRGTESSKLSLHNNSPLHLLISMLLFPLTKVSLLTLGF